MKAPKRVSVLFAAFACAVWLLQPAVAHALLLRMSVEQMAQAASSVVVVHVGSAHAERVAAPAVERIKTHVGLTVEGSLKGSHRAGDTFGIDVPGGRVGNARLVVLEQPTFAPGENALVFLDAEGRVIGGLQGKLDVVNGQVPSLRAPLGVVEQRVVGGRGPHGASLGAAAAVIPAESAGPITQNLSVPSISSISPTSASAGTDSQVTITGSGFGATQGTGVVNFTYDPSGGSAWIQGQIVSWSDTQINVIVPIADIAGYPASAGSGPVQVVTSGGTSNLGYLDVPFGYGGAKWDTHSVPFKVNPTTSSQNAIHFPDPHGSIDSAANTWTSAGAAFKFVDTGTTSNPSNGNGVNEVWWGSLQVGILGQTSYYTDFSGTLLTETDFEFNSFYTWTDDGTGYDAQSVATHEMGHWLNLRDLYGPGDTNRMMYGYGDTGIVKRTLDPGDVAGIQWIYGELLSTTATGFVDGAWRNTSALVSLTATYPVVGVASTWWRKDGGSVNAYTGPFTVSGQEIHTVEYGSVGNDASREPTRTATIKIDSTPPSTTATGFVDGAWRNTPADVTLQATDTGGSNVASTWYRVNGGSVAFGTGFSVTATGADYLEWGSTDNAGNRETTESALIKLDTVAPSTPGGLSWTSVAPSRVSLRWDASTDDTSGVASYRIYVDASLATETALTNTTVTVVPGADHTISVLAVDAAGNVSAPATLVFNASAAAEARVLAGTDVTASVDATPAGRLGFKFAQVTTPGTITVIPIRSLPSTSSISPGWRIFAGVTDYDVSFSGSFTGTVTVTLPYDAALSDGRAAGLRVFHYAGGSWTDVTLPGTVDTLHHTIAVELSSFSPLAFGESSTVPEGSSTSARFSTGTNPVTVSYNAYTTVSVQVKDAAGVPLPGAALSYAALWTQPAGKSWSKSAIAPTVSGSTASFRLRTTANTSVQVRFAGDPFNVASQSGTLVIYTKVSLSAPTASSYRPRLNAYFRVTGLLSPSHNYGAKSVVIYAEHYESGRWVNRGSWSATNYTYNSTTTKYQANIHLTRRGSWRLRAYHKDSSHAATYSSYSRLFSVG